MSLKKTLFVIGLVIALLLPAALILKNQTPWNCFGFTLDESFFAQAASNWSEGKGYRMNGTLPFDPTITAGIPMAWGASFLHGITGESIANSGRLFVYLSFIAVLFMLARSAFRRDRNWLAVPLTLWFFCFGLSKIPSGGYFAFGFLGEMPGFLLSVFAYRALDEKKFTRAGFYSVLVFFMKPTFLFFLPAVGLAALFHSGKAALRTGLAQLVTLVLFYSAIANIRNESIAAYLNLFFQQSRDISLRVPPGSLLGLYATMGTIPTALSVAYLATGSLATLRARKVAPGMVAAFLFFLFSSLYFLAIGHRPVEKQWGAVLCLALVGFAVPWAGAIAGRFSGWIPKEYTRAVILAVVLTWALSVGQNALHAYKRIPETACPSKEQNVINDKLRALADSGEVTKENLGAVIEFHPYTLSLYRLGWDPSYQESWAAFKGKTPKWVYGETKKLFPAPTGCASYFRGETFTVLRCGN